MNERPDIDRIKAELAAAIVKLIDDRKLNDMEAAQRLTLARTEVARLRAGDVVSFSIDHLVAILNSLEQNVTVCVMPARKSPADNRPIWEKIAEITASVPPEEWEKVPVDLAQNLDHYLYGAKKRD